MSRWIDWYKVLQVQHFADKEVIKAAYKKLCTKYHPDCAATDDGGEMIRKLNRAYGVLGNDEHRKAYDKEWHRNTKPSNSDMRKKSCIPCDSAEAKKVMSHYFTCLASNLYEDAYALLCDSDKKNVPYEHFVKWQRSVTSIYLLRDFKVTDSKRYIDFLRDGYTPCTAERVTLAIHEENLSTSADSKYTLYKFVLYENEQWRIYLGYRDVLSLSEEVLQQAS